MKKLEKKQVPAVVALVVISVGAVGYTLYSLMGASQTGNTPSTAASPGPAYGPGDETRVDPITGQAATSEKKLAELQAVPASFKTDPFNPTIAEANGQDTAKRAEKFGRDLGKAFAGLGKALSGAFGSGSSAPSLPPSGEWVPASLRDFANSEGLSEEPTSAPPVAAAPAPAPQPAPEPLVRPSLILTGIIEGDTSVAILRGDQDERHFVQVNDRVA